MYGFNEQDNHFYFIIIIIIIMIMIMIIIIITIIIAVISERDWWERGWLRRNSVRTWDQRNVFCLDIESIHYSHKVWVAIALYANILCTTLYWKIIRFNVFLIWWYSNSYTLWTAGKTILRSYFYLWVVQRLDSTKYYTQFLCRYVLLTHRASRRWPIFYCKPSVGWVSKEGYHCSLPWGIITP